jgi:hypothetical protein
MPVGSEGSRPAGEGDSHTARTHITEESDSGIVPMNHSNQDGKPLVESEEGRPLIKENTHQSGTHPTQSGARVSQGLAGVRRAAREGKETKFTALLHHLTVDLLRELLRLEAESRPRRGRGSRGRSMRPGWKVDWLIYTAGFIAGRTEPNPRGECSSPSPTGDNVR